MEMRKNDQLRSCSPLAHPKQYGPGRRGKQQQQASGAGGSGVQVLHGGCSGGAWVVGRVVVLVVQSGGGDGVHVHGTTRDTSLVLTGLSY